MCVCVWVYVCVCRLVGWLPFFVVLVGVVRKVFEFEEVFEGMVSAFWETMMGERPWSTTKREGAASQRGFGPY